jgi:hypothetical protein
MPSTRPCRSGFSEHGTLLYQSRGTEVSRESAASVPDLSPVELSARIHSTSELLRILSRVAASKPTSWLSRRIHILSH